MEGFFNDGMTYLFMNDSGLQEIRPRHIHFSVLSETVEGMESCDFRFYSVEKVVAETKASRRLADEAAKPEDKKSPADADKTAADADPADNGADESNTEKKEEEVTRAPTGPNAEYKAVEFSDVAFFRLGFFDYAKLNTENMLVKYEAGVWYAVDLLMDWSEQRVSIYINGDEYKSTTFFTQSKDKLTSANAVSIYGLSPGSISKFKDIRICNEVCSAEAG